MTNCNYPECTKTELNEWGMCEQHEGKYSYYPSSGGKKAFDLQRIQEGLKRFSKNAPAYIDPDPNPTKLAKIAQRELM